MPCSATYFLEVSVHLLNIATKVSFRDPKIRKFTIFKTFFLKQKRRSAIKKSSRSDKFLMLTPSLDLYFLEVNAQILLKLAAKGSFRGKKI